MRYRCLAAALCGLFLHLSASAAAADSILPPVVEELSDAVARLSADSGFALPSASLPLSPAAAVAALAALGSGGPGVQDELSSALQALQGQDGARVGVDLQMQYEHYFRPPAHALSVSDFVELVEVVDPLALLRLSFQLDNSTALAIAVALRREYNRSPIDSNFFPSVSGNPVAIENNNITEGYFRSARGPFELTFGRQPIHIGPSPEDSLLLSKRLPFIDALDLKGHFGPLTMTLVISTLENRQAVPDVDPGSADYAFARTVILSNTHYFEYSFGFLRFGIGAQYLAVRPGNAFQAVDFFPVISWHQTNIVPNNLSMVADFSIVPFRGLTIYGQGGLDDINLSSAGVNDSGVPTVPGFILGMQWQGRARGVEISARLEGGWTHYLWGSFDDSSAMARAIYRMDIDGVRRFIPLTSPYGPGAAWATAALTLSTPWGLDAGLRLRQLARNPSANLATTAYEADPQVASAHLAQWFQAVMELRWTPVEWLSFSAAPELDVSDGEAWFGLTLGGGIGIGGNYPVSDARRSIVASP